MFFGLHLSAEGRSVPAIGLRRPGAVTARVGTRNIACLWLQGVGGYTAGVRIDRGWEIAGARRLVTYNHLHLVSVFTRGRGGWAFSRVGLC